MKRRVVTAFTSCAVLFGVGLAARRAAPQTEKRPAYTIVWQETTYDSSGIAIPESVETKYVSSNGNAYSLKQYADGKKEEMFSIVGKGVFLKRGQKLHFMSDCTLMPPRTAEDMKSRNRFLKTETVLGLPTVVISPVNDQDGNLQIYFAQVLNAEIKTIVRGGRTLVKEPVSLVFGEPDPKLFKFPDELAIDYTNYEKLHGPRKNQ